MATTLAPAATTQTIDFSTGNIQAIDLSSATGNVTVSFANPVAGGSYAVKLTQGTTARSVTWPAAVKWANGLPLTLSVTSGAVDLISLFYDGTSYYAVGGNNFQ